MIKRTLILFLSVSLIVGCIPIEEPSSENFTLRFANMGYSPTHPSAVQLDIVDRIFPKQGALSLIEGEKETLQYRMLERYNDGFYEPLVQPLIANDMKGVFDFAKDEDGTTMQSLNQNYRKEIERVMTRLPEEMLWNIRFTAANSVVMSQEMLEQSGFWGGDLNKEEIQANRDFMFKLYTDVSMEIDRRKQ